MKIAVIGGAGVRTPLLAHGLTHADLPVRTLSLYDPDQERLALVASLARSLTQDAEVVTCRSAAECLEAADFIITSIRVGGIARRARDEAAALALGVIGQETVGPGGFALAMRTIPHMVGYAREAERVAPHAWIINFTNPVGIVTQAVRAATGAKIIGICDTPIELCEAIAHALGLPTRECYFDYFGLNHLGWIREVYHHGEAQLARLWGRLAHLEALYRAPLFDARFLDQLRLLPTEYLYYYYRPHDALENIRRAGRSRGLEIDALNAKLFADLREPGAERVKVYEDYLATRNAGYMCIESGSAPAEPSSPFSGPTGYDRIALWVIRAIHANSGAIIPLNVANRGTLPDLEPDDEVEVPCVVNRNGALPLHVGEAPARVRDLLRQVKEYERLTVRAALSGDRCLARDALGCHPLVGSRDLAERLVAALEPLQADKMKCGM